ncbi:P44/Msp2 family outer membrane protein [Wolbachia endosymbiont of Aedes aegypti]|uniref:P44/Msp2 family outer membrane protein n=2 Tax=Wolbachia pipientis TaxID=955 RepID=A0A6C1U7J4_WOLPI|nr:P44/Msp2 family outer membrane protein [Wolbachia endosymbiont of Aedes albopictus]THA19604.1 P44/Msp2 family outer membrane protein [Wolbachia endosymbiont of Aedes albopictus]TVS92706.1 P44/Msp2 family outer membrane protein [Wolbachia pipientis]TVS99285.1 P44/Msp2 family outer membrane protein [Wolbachia pipientis]UYC23949.1 P44/Msp2 family outer membrane protein [Wolbachia endosymbiont of Aedes aegypti]
MMSKKTLAVTALALLLSQQSFASETEGFYFGGGYYGQYLNLGGLKAKIGGKDATDANKVSINDRNAQSTKGQLISKYKGDYNPPFAANVALGYTGELGNNSYRAELEGMYSSVKVDNVGLTSGQMTISYTEGSDQYGSIINHDKIENISVMANVYHYWKSDSFSFSPYVGIGVGGTRMTMFEESSMRPAGQLKAGFDYHINEDVNMHIGYRGFGVFGSSEYKPETLKWDAQAKKMDKQTGDDKVTTTIQNGFFHTHGIEAGLTFHFASKA